MCGDIVCIAVVLLGIDVGWRPLPDGGVEYQIQIEPQVIETLKAGQPIYSDIPRNVKDVRAYRITVGTEQLTRELPATEEVKSADAPLIPNLILPDPESRPIDDVQQTAENVDSAVEPARAELKPESTSPSEQGAQKEKPQPAEATRPWVPLTIALFTLFGSLGANVYLGWITWGVRSRYRALVQKLDNRALEIS
jgi:hypothetical protein